MIMTDNIEVVLPVFFVGFLLSYVILEGVYYTARRDPKNVLAINITELVLAIILGINFSSMTFMIMSMGESIISPYVSLGSIVLYAVGSITSAKVFNRNVYDTKIK